MGMTSLLLDGRYRLIAPIARGGMSVVWEGRDEVLARAIAVKVIARTGDPVTGAAFVEDVRREAMAIARLTHPHIATVYDYGESTDAFGTPMSYLVMELVEGESLARVLGRGRLSWPTAVGICAEVASALAAAHRTGVVHQDITPGNVMLAAGGVKVIDFGIAATTGDRSRHPVFGTPAYLAPERVSGGPARPATDVYGLGLLIYESLAGHLPWPAATATRMVTAHREIRPAPLPPIGGLPTIVVDLCRGCLAVDPDRRPTSAEVFPALADIARRGDRKSRPVPVRARVLPHGAAVLVDPRATTVPLASGGAVNPPIGSGASDSPVAGRVARSSVASNARIPRNGLFVLPAILLVIMLGCVGLVRWHQYGGGVASGPRPAVTPGPSVPGRPAVPRPSSSAAAKVPVEPKASPSCRISYRTLAEWFYGYTAQVTVANNGGVPIPGWTLRFRLPTGQSVAGGWDGRWRQTGRTVTVRDMIYNRIVEPGSSVTLGFVGRVEGTGGVRRPSRFAVNGHACAIE